MSPGFMLLLVAVLIAANALFVAAEFALVAVRRGAIEERARAGDRRARTTLLELQRLSFVLSSAQFGITVTSLLVGFLAEDAIGQTVVTPIVRAVGLPESSERGIAVVTAFLLSTILQMVVGELAPKNLAIARPEGVSLWIAPIHRIFGNVFGPIIRVFDRSAGWVTGRVFGVDVQDELAGGLTLDEIQRIVAASSVEGTLSGHQAELLSRAVALGDRRVVEVMVPAPDVVWLDGDAPVATLRERSRATGHSRFPVRLHDGGDTLGTVHIKDLLTVDADAHVRDLATGCLVVPESEPLRRLLGRFRDEQRTFAVVVDEYGSVAGIATVEDVVEQLVGDIEDEFDTERSAAVRRLGRGRFRVSGRLRLDRFEAAVGVTVPHGDYETVAGLVMDGLGRVPDEGERLDLDGVSLEVTRMVGVRIAEVDAKVAGEAAP